MSDLNTTWSSSFSMDKQMSSKKSVSARSVAQSCPTLATPWTVAWQAPLSMEFSRQEHWSGLPFPPPGDLSDPGIETASPVLAGGFFTIVPPGKRITCKNHLQGKGWNLHVNYQNPALLPEPSLCLPTDMPTWDKRRDGPQTLPYLDLPTAISSLNLSSAPQTHTSIYLGVQPNTSKTNSKPTPFNFLISVTDTSVLLVALVKQLGVPLAVSLTLHSIHQHILSTPLSIRDLISSHCPLSLTKVLGNISICHSGFLNGLLVSTPFPTVQSTFHATPRVNVGLTPFPQLPSQGKSCGSHQSPQALQDTEHLRFLLPSQGSPSSLCSYPPLVLTHAQPAPGSRPLFTLSPPPTLSPDLCHSLPPFL